MGDSALAVEAWEALFRAQVTVMRRLTADFPNNEITIGDYDALFTLSRAPEHRLRLKNLAENMLLTQPSVSRLIDRLVARGLVTKTGDPADRRGIIVELTETGYHVFHRTALAHSRSIIEHLDGVLSPGEFETLIELCTKLKTGVIDGSR